MKDATFEYIWKNIVLPSIDKVAELCNECDKIKDYEFKKRDLRVVYHRMIGDYDIVRRQLKNRYYKVDDNDDEKNLIDTHKIAACLCYSMICNKPFSFLIKENMPKKIFLSNYSVAYYASIGFIYASLIAEYNINRKGEFAAKLQEYGKMYEPPVSKGHNDYNEGRIYALAQNDIYGNTFDILAYADMMYWIELYTRQKVENTINPVPLDRCELPEK